MPGAVEKIIKPRPFQERTLDLLDAGVRYIAMMCGTGSGKTWWAPKFLAYLISRDVEAGNGKGARYLDIGRTYRMTTDILVPELLDSFADTALEGYYRASKETYELPTGGTVYFRSADKPFRIEGHHARGALMDEPSEMPAMIWIVVQRRTGYYQAPVLMTGYPTNMGWYRQSIFEPWEKGDPDYAVIQGPSTLNPEYPAEEMKRAEATLPRWIYEMTYLGLFSKPFGLVYPDFGTHLFCEPFDIPSDWPTYTIVDPAVQYGALMLGWNHGIYYAYNEYYDDVVHSAKEYASAMLEKVEGVSQGWIYDPARLTDVVNLGSYAECPECGGDCTELVEEWRASGKCPLCGRPVVRLKQCGPFYKANNAVQPGIVTLTGLIKGGRFKVMRGRCPVFCDQMGKYRWPTDLVTGKIVEGAERPIKKDDDLPDCARYGVHTLEGVPLEEKPRRERLTYEDRQQITEY